ncbi:uncharacterized protein L203_102634 [Cryptococcus depauperatus CBS 7841]|uniref:Uncharacterized protein n=1 Tax=Cryptococcus depauperatus CBS 7841 TaxID=1295531 RepID=A0A1E3IG87_9TREE|nr:hypothetical protein L203_04000 [Cryptococcus depauperatus CBS 7841]
MTKRKLGDEQLSHPRKKSNVRAPSPISPFEYPEFPVEYLATHGAYLTTPSLTCPQPAAAVHYPYPQLSLDMSYVAQSAQVPWGWNAYPSSLPSPTALSPTCAPVHLANPSAALPSPPPSSHFQQTFLFDLPTPPPSASSGSDTASLVTLRDPAPARPASARTLLAQKRAGELPALFNSSALPTWPLALTPSDPAGTVTPASYVTLRDRDAVIILADPPKPKLSLKEPVESLTTSQPLPLEFSPVSMKSAQPFQDVEGTPERDL